MNMATCAEVLLSCTRERNTKPADHPGTPQPDFLDEYLAHVGVYLGLIFDLQTSKTGAVYPKAEEARRKNSEAPVRSHSQTLQDDSTKEARHLAEDPETKEAKLDHSKTPKQSKRVLSSTKKRIRRTNKTPVKNIPMFETLLQKMEEKTPKTPALNQQAGQRLFPLTEEIVGYDLKEKKKKSKSPRTCNGLSAFFGKLLVKKERPADLEVDRQKTDPVDAAFDPTDFDRLGETTIRPITANRSLLSQDRIQEDFDLLCGLDSEQPKKLSSRSKPLSPAIDIPGEEDHELLFLEHWTNSHNFVDLARFESATATPKPSDFAAATLGLAAPGPDLLTQPRHRLSLPKDHSKDSKKRELDDYLRGLHRDKLRPDLFRKKTPQLGKQQDLAASHKRHSHNPNFSLKVDIGNIYINTVPSPKSRYQADSHCSLHKKHHAAFSPEPERSGLKAVHPLHPRSSLRDRQAGPSFFNGHAEAALHRSAEREAHTQPLHIPRLNIQQATQKRVKSKTPVLLGSYLTNQEQRQDSATLRSHKETSRELRSPLLLQSARGTQDLVLEERSATLRGKLASSAIGGQDKKQLLLDKIKNKFRLEIQPKTDRLGVPLKHEDKEASAVSSRFKPDHLVRSSVRLSEKSGQLRVQPKPEASHLRTASKLSAKQASTGLTSSLKQEQLPKNK